VLVAVVWIFPLAGARGASAGDPRLWLLLAQVSGLAGSGFVLNQLQDLAGDSANAKCPTLARGLASPREARALAVLLLCGALLASLALGPWHLAAAGLFFLLTGLCYNLPPCRAKDRPLLAPLLAAPAFALLLLQGSALRGGLGLALGLWSGLPLVLAGISMSLLATVPDRAGDAAAGKRTWTVAFGARSTWRASCLLMAVAALLALAGRDLQVGLPALSAALLMLRQARRKADAGEPADEALRVLRWSAALQGLALAPSWPGLVLLLLLFLLGARVYYRRRFGLDYPSLRA
jgi:4-hydroxybenzoate polyprenyltransferase